MDNQDSSMQNRLPEETCIFDLAVPEIQSATSAGRRKPRLMVVDDHSAFRNCLIQVLREVEGLDIVAIAGDGWQAVVLATQLYPDIVLMDVNMPVLNGIEATKMIAEALPETRVIGLSMHSEDGTSEKMRAAGAVDHLLKDGPVEELLASIQSQLALIGRSSNKVGSNSPGKISKM
jgi:DNA-binding NarL/FixJ family response regulator